MPDWQDAKPTGADTWWLNAWRNRHDDWILETSFWSAEYIEIEKTRPKYKNCKFLGPLPIPTDLT